MDKEEFRVKLDQINHLVEKRDYKGAMEVVDSIDWRRVKNVRTLCVVGEIYAANKRYEDSKEIFLLAYHRAPIGKNILYRLIEVSLKVGNIDEAMEYYEEFLQVAPNDSTRYILKYKICKENHTDLNDLIQILEEYKEKEFTEKWSYELAKLYHEAGEDKKCIALCDELVLWFSEGKYVSKALELKMTVSGVPVPQEKEEKEQELQMTSEEAQEENEEETPKEELPEEGSSRIESISTREEDVLYSTSIQEKITKGIRDIFNPKKAEAEEETEEVEGDQEEILNDSFSEEEIEEVPNLEEEDGSVKTEKKDDKPLKMPELKIPEGMKNTGMDEALNIPKMPTISKVELVAPKEKEEEEIEFNLEDTILAAASAQGIEIPEEKTSNAVEEEISDEELEDELEEYEDEEISDEELEDELEEYEDEEISDEELEDELEEYEDEEISDEELEDELKEYEDEEFSDEEYEDELEAEMKFFDDTRAAKSEEKVSKKKMENDLDFASWEKALEEEEQEVLEEDEDVSDEEFSDEEFEDEEADEYEMDELEEEENEYLPEEQLQAGPLDIVPRGNVFTEEEVQLFSYFVEVPGMKEQIIDALMDAQEAASDKTSRTGNIVVMGGRETGKTKLISALIPSICRELNLEASKVAYVFAEQIEGKNIAEIVSKLSGGFLVIAEASTLTKKTVEQLNKAMEFRTDGLTVILEDQKSEMRKLLSRYPKFAEKFTSKINIPVFTNDELVGFADVYTRENGFCMDAEGMTALYNLISSKQDASEPMSIGTVREILNAAIKKSQSGILKLKRKRTDEAGYQILTDKDFN